MLLYHAIFPQSGLKALEKSVMVGCGGRDEVEVEVDQGEGWEEELEWRLLN
jgi:hypothetical protein